MRLIDTHTHLDGFARRGELAGVLERARAAGVISMIAIGTEPGDWSLLRDLAAAHCDRIHYSVGLHPCSVEPGWKSAVEGLALAREWSPAPVAIGETGLDRFHLPRDPAAAEEAFRRQQESFRFHLELAAEWGLPVVVHSRGAAGECIDLIDRVQFPWERVVFHCFAEGPEVMTEVARRGGRGSFGGIATYKNAGNVREAALRQGLERLMLETDAPYLTPEPHRGKPNEPAMIAHTAARLATLFEIGPEELGEITSRNARAFFQL